MTDQSSTADLSFRSGALERAELEQCFAKNGVVILRGLLGADFISYLRDRIHRLIDARLRSLGGETSSEGIDACLARLLAFNQIHAMDVIRAARSLPEFYRAFTDPVLLGIVQRLLRTEVLQCIHDIAQFRIDPPNYDERNFTWHQDFQYNVASLNAVTAWFPLTSVTEEMGNLAVVPGTHDRIVPVIEDRSRHTSGRGTAHSTLRFDVDPAELERRAVLLDGIEPGDVVFFHCLLLHRSGRNRSTRARLVMNPRYAEALDSAVVQRGWIAMSDRTQDVFARYYPDSIRQAAG
jgi:ectoine hydroxylase-related dioxygenase (phytanoyl-CoA dioxygenase family)